MVVQHNLYAMNTNRQLGLTTGFISKSSEKLSSGYKINRAADNAVGLSISEKMRKQIRGLDQASENIEDGISLCQVADGALNETVDILQRMRELSIQSANGTNSKNDRKFIEMEITQLKSEVDRIAITTKFNDVIYPLNAPPISYTTIENEIVTVPTVPDVPEAPSPDVPTNVPHIDMLKEKTITFTTDTACTYDGKKYNKGDTITISGLTSNDTEVWVMGGAAYPGIGWGSWNSSSKDPNNLWTLTKSNIKVDHDGYIYYPDKSNKPMYAVWVTDPGHLGSGNPDPLHFEDKPTALSKIAAGWASFIKADTTGSQTPNPPPPPDPPPPFEQVIRPVVKRHFRSANISVNIQAGASSSQNDKIPIHIVNATCIGLGITNLTVVTEESSDEAMDLLNDAISRVSTYRSAFGATQNRLEHAQRIDDNTAENTQAAESKIRDTNMAAEMIKYSNANILIQAGQSMLAQANQSRQGILSLLA